MKNLYYSEKQKMAFWVSGYDTNSFNAIEIIKYLQENLDKASELMEIDKDKILTFFIDNSRMYKYMRVFYGYSATIPKNAYNIGKNLTMQDWIIN